MKIYFADSLAFRNKYSLDFLLQGIPQTMHENARRYKFPRDAFNYALGRLMVKHGLKILERDISLSDMQFLKNDKPFLEGVRFNISHSADLVVCIIDPQVEVGIDIEAEKEIDLASFESCFTPKEWRDIQLHPNALKRFYWYWTRKESIIKALGVNLDYLHKIEIDPTNDFFSRNGKTWHLRDLNFRENFAGAVCSEIEIPGNVVPENFADCFQGF